MRGELIIFIAIEGNEPKGPYNNFRWTDFVMIDTVDENILEQGGISVECQLPPRTSQSTLCNEQV